MSQRDNIAKLKEEYVKYFQDVPVQRYAAMFLGRDEDTIMRWKKDDSNFADAVQRAYAVWIRKTFVKTKAEFALERLEKGVFSQRQELEIKQEPIGVAGTGTTSELHEVLMTYIKESTKAPEPGDDPDFVTIKVPRNKS